MLAFRDPETFVAGYLHNCFPAWERISKCAPFELTPKILHWIKNCVDIHEFFRPFKGQYKGENFDSSFPPRKTFPNAISCKPFSKFISDTIIARLASGAISLWGKVCHVMLPLLLSSQCVMTNPGTIISCFAQRVVPILVFNGVDGFLRVILYPLAGNPRHTSTILLGFSPPITFVLFLYLARCTSMIATQGKSSYPSRLQLMPLSPRNGRNPLLGHHPQFL